MNLRPELLPPQVSPERIEELGREIDRIAALRGDAAREAEAAFAETTGHSYEDFREYWGAESREEAALRALRPAYPRVPDITRDELVEIVRRIQTSHPDQDWYLLLLETNTSHPTVSDLIFWPPPELESATPEQIVDTALSHHPIPL
ncbi:hypothetical protein [Actinomadura rugatobispora]|uniref:SMI1/KNR4 family protein n=1 Tax=Actinomadura rugatobispora TaxID=1994 RepID=A0ABW1AEP0_9ACTN|nr:hypothetical protein GCM10010200_054280 [Actinomadura rugatobispora]